MDGVTSALGGVVTSPAPPKRKYRCSRGHAWERAEFSSGPPDTVTFQAGTRPPFVRCHHCMVDWIAQQSQFGTVEEVWTHWAPSGVGPNGKLPCGASPRDGYTDKPQDVTCPECRHMLPK